MRDKRFVAIHRGGSLTKDNHRQLMHWARKCSEHVLPLLELPIDDRLLYALQIAKEWEEGQVNVGKAMKASLGAHAVARELSNPASIAIARAIGQTVATAHMADHSLGGALYGLKAVQQAGNSIEKERQWQTSQLQKLPSEIVELVQATLIQKAAALKGFGDFFT
ncbi:hypothetical protein IC229_04595 [Spirosoma sp. BT702]|uniref:Imm-5-like domain-containing protein n=1 Tax=Spirosoma profusum TaxID=2771354 RepID=A0A926XUN9_9BACT|nr:hypothetical protein [Spirosoma profusum]MBD2699901.1 hypothetical protein [Spirosoma profusum]